MARLGSQGPDGTFSRGPSCGRQRGAYDCRATAALAGNQVAHLPREHVAGAPPYDPTLATVDASYFFGLYPYYGYQGYMAFLPTTTGSLSAKIE